MITGKWLHKFAKSHQAHDNRKMVALVCKISLALGKPPTFGGSKHNNKTNIEVPVQRTLTSLSSTVFYNREHCVSVRR